MGAIVRAFDVRPVCKEQVESMGATFLEVDIEEDGSGTGGYAKEMSDEYKAAQAAMMMEQAADVDVMLIPSSAVTGYAFFKECRIFAARYKHG